MLCWIATAGLVAGLVIMLLLALSALMELPK